MQVKCGNSQQPTLPGLSVGESKTTIEIAPKLTFYKLTNIYIIKLTNHCEHHRQDAHNHLGTDGLHPCGEWGSWRERGKPKHFQRIRSFQGYYEEIVNHGSPN